MGCKTPFQKMSKIPDYSFIICAQTTKYCTCPCRAPHCPGAAPSPPHGTRHAGRGCCSLECVPIWFLIDGDGASAVASCSYSPVWCPLSFMIQINTFHPASCTTIHQPTVMKPSLFQIYTRVSGIELQKAFNCNYVIVESDISTAWLLRGEESGRL